MLEGRYHHFFGNTPNGVTWLPILGALFWDGKNMLLTNSKAEKWHLFSGTKRSLFSFGPKSHWVVRLMCGVFSELENTGHFPWNEFTAGFSPAPWKMGGAVPKVSSRGRQPSNPKDPTPSCQCFREITSWNPNCCAFFNIFMARFKKKNAEKETKNSPCTSLFTHKSLFSTKLINFRETLLYGSPGDLRKSRPTDPHLQSRGSDFKRLYRFLGFFQDFNFKDVYWLIILDRSTRWLWKQPIWNILKRQTLF